MNYLIPKSWEAAGENNRTAVLVQFQAYTPNDQVILSFNVISVFIEAGCL